jgi:carboxyl-terminal processing protease
MKRTFISVLIILAFFTACKKEITPKVFTDKEKARDELYNLMNYWYYWYDLMPQVDTLDYADPYLLMDAMRYKDLDRWSFVEDYNEFVAYYAGSFVGHGFRIGIDDSGKARMVFLYKNSDLYLKGVRRGWIVKTINGYNIASIIISGDAAAYTTAIGPSEEGVKNTFVFVTPKGKDTTITSTKSTIDVNSVLLYDTLHLSSGITGHLVFESFIEPSVQELNTAFAYFKQNNVTDLILDLRYNSGGLLNVAQGLASYIAGNSKTGTTFVKMEYNIMRRSNDITYNFENTNYPLNLKRLAVITSRSTASASEAVINGLIPHMQVVCFGDTTEGKPTGMNIWSYDDIYIFAPVTFKNENSAGHGDFFDGLFPSKLVNDDITHDFDDRKELCLKEAIKYLETGIISSKGQYIYKRSIQISEKPKWQSNLFVNIKKL